MAKYAKAAGGNWSAAATWSATSSAGADSAGAPAATDDVIFDAGANNAVTVDTTTCVAKTVTCQNAVNNIAFGTGFKLTVSGNVTFASGMTISGSGNLTINAASTFQSNGVTLTGSLTFNINGTITLSSNTTVNGLVTIATNTTTLNTNTLTCAGGFTATGGVAGTTTINLTGGTWSGDSNHANPFTIAGNVTFSGRVRITTGFSFTYNSGTVTLSNSIFYINVVTSTITCNGLKLGTLQMVGATTGLTLGSDLIATTIFFGGAVGINNFVFLGSFNIITDYLLHMGASVTASGTGATLTLTMANGTTMTVNTAISLTNTTTGYNIAHIKSTTASNMVYLTYSGARTDMCITGMTFTDVDASGSSVELENINGGTLTRTVNIVNRTMNSLVNLIGTIA